MSPDARTTTFSFTPPHRGSARPRDPGTPFHLLVAGDFSGRASRGGTEPLDPRTPRTLDVDQLETRLGELDVRLPMDGGGLKVRAMDDFHPEALLRNVPQLNALRELKTQLQHGAPPARILAELQALTGLDDRPPPTDPPPEPPPATPDHRESDHDLVERLLGRPRSDANDEPTRPEHARASQFIRDLVAPHVVPAPATEPQRLADRIDAQTAEGLRARLHHPAFQALEAHWRGLDFLVRRLDIGDRLQVRILDATRAEIEADLRQPQAASALHRLLVADPATPGQEPWSLVAGLYDFTPSDPDVECLGRLAELGAAAGAPFLGAAVPAAFDAAPAAWTALRQNPAAKWLVLGMPRFLLRLPYGRATDPLDALPFEEMPQPPQPAQYLWGHPALFCATLLAQSFLEADGDFSPDDNLEMDELPLHTFADQGEARAMPCTEFWLNDTEADRHLERGLLPLLAVRGRPAVRLRRWQSIAAPPAPPAGRWR